MMSERFERWNDYSCKVKDNQEDTLLRWEDVVKKLNEQQSIINKLKSDIEETEISVKLFEDDIATKDKKIEEQQTIIQELERKLKKYEKIGEEQLKQIIELQDEINDCEKFRYTVFKRIGELIE